VHVGNDRQPGDILVSVTDSSLHVDEFIIVIEARDDKTARGRKRVADDMTTAMKERKALYGLYVSKTQTGLAKEIGDWSEGRCAQGPFVACTAENIVTALRFALVDSRIRALREVQPEADTSAIQQEVRRLRTAARRLRTIKTKAGSIHKGADAVGEEASQLQREMSDALAAIENAVRGAEQAAA
jgi:hypothetical protein